MYSLIIQCHAIKLSAENTRPWKKEREEVGNSLLISPAPISKTHIQKTL